jgi:hypothetical protein
MRGGFRLPSAPQKQLASMPGLAHRGFEERYGLFSKTFFE